MTLQPSAPRTHTTIHCSQPANPFCHPSEKVKRELSVLRNHKGHLAKALEEANLTSAKNKVKALLYIALQDRLPAHSANMPLPVDRQHKA